MAKDLVSIGLVTLASVAGGLHFLRLGLRQARADRAFLRNSTEVEGVIVEWILKPNPVEDALDSYAARVRFRPVGQPPVTFLSGHLAFRHDEPTGGRVTVVYPRNQPKRAEVTGLLHRRGGAILLGVVGSACLALAGFLVYVVLFGPDSPEPG